MDNFQNQNIPPVLPPQQQNTSSNISWLKTLSIGFSLVSLGIAIGIGGYVLGTKKNQSVSQDQQVASPTPLPAETSVKEGDPTANPDLIGANWKTYTNSSYRFRVKYPPTLELIDRTNQFPPFTIFITDKSKQVPYEGGTTINPYLILSVKPNQGTLFDYVNNPNNNLVSTGVKKFGKNEFIDAKEKAGMAAANQDQYLTQQDSYIISFQNSLYGIEQNTFNQILSTFKFTDQK